MQPWQKPASKTLSCEDYASIEQSDFVLYNNVWNANAAGQYKWSQCLERKPDNMDIVGWSWDWPAGERQIFGYPQVKKGTSPWAPLPHIDKRFPVNISEIQHLKVSHAIDATTNGDFNVATSFWITDRKNIGKEPNKDTIRAEVMVWSYYTPGHIMPAGQNIGTVTLANQKWSIWLDKDWGDASGANTNSWIYLAFRAEKPSLQAEFDLATLLNSPMLADIDLGDYYIADVEVGTEVMGGKGHVWLNEFNIQLDTKELP